MSEQRLDRIEGSIDRLTGKIDDMAVVVTALAVASNTHKTAAGEWFIRLLIATAVAGIGYMMRS